VLILYCSEKRVIRREMSEKEGHTEKEKNKGKIEKWKNKRK